MHVKSSNNHDAVPFTRVSDPDPCLHGSALIWVAGSGSAFNMRIRIQRDQKWPTKKEKKKRNFMFWIAGCSLLRAEDFEGCSLGVLYRGLGNSKLQFLIKKHNFVFKYFSIFGYQNPVSRTRSGAGSAIWKNAGSATLPLILLPFLAATPEPG